MEAGAEQGEHADAVLALKMEAGAPSRVRGGPGKLETAGSGPPELKQRGWRVAVLCLVSTSAKGLEIKIRSPGDHPQA